MEDSENSPDTLEAKLVVRHLKLDDVSKKNKQIILNEIETTYGVDSVTFEEQASTLHIAYDATQCDLNGLEGILQKHGADISHDWETIFKEGYYRFIDSNIRDHAVNEVWGGHNDPSKPAKTSKTSKPAKSAKASKTTTMKKPAP